MPAVDERGRKIRASVPKARKVYGPPAPKRQIAGPPAPKPRRAPPRAPRREPRAPTFAEQQAHRARTRNAVRAEPKPPKRVYTERTAPGPSAADVERYKGSESYARTLAAAKLSRRAQESKRAIEAKPATAPKLFKVIPTGGKRKIKFADGGNKGTDAFQTKGKSLEQLASLNEVLDKARKQKAPDAQKTIGQEWNRAITNKKMSPAAEKILKGLMAETHAEAGAVSAALHGKNPIKGAKESVQKEHKTFSTVLKEQGVPKGVAGPVGTVADIGLAPSTYLLLGRGTVAKEAAKEAAKSAGKSAAAVAAATATTRTTAREAAEKAAKDAVKKGADEAAAKKVYARTEKRTTREVIKQRGRAAGAAAAKRVEGKAKPHQQTKGLTIHFAGKRVPVLTTATGAAAHGTKLLARKTIPKVVREGAGKAGRTVVRQVHPQTRAHGVTEAEHVAGKAIVSRAQAHVTHGDQRAIIIAQALRHVPEAQHEAFIKALETRRLAPLADNATAVAADKKRVAQGGGKPHVQPGGKVFELAYQTRAKLQQAYKEGRRSGAIKGKVGDTREYLTRADLGALKGTVVSEAKGAARRHERIKHGVRREEGRRALAEEAAKGTAAKTAAVATERAEGRARTQQATAYGRERVQAEREYGGAVTAAQRERHATEIGFERAHAGARVSAAKTKTSPTLKQRQSGVNAATRARNKARTALVRAQDRLKKEQAKPVGRRRGVPVLHARVADAKHALAGAEQAIKDTRAGVSTERKRISGVAPKQHESLLGAIERKAEPVAAPVRAQPMSPAARERLTREGEQAVIDRAIPMLRPLREREVAAARASRRTPRVEPAAPGGKRLEKADFRLAEHTQKLGEARTRKQAAEAIPARNVGESHEQYLTRIVAYADRHGLDLVKSRAEKLLAAKPKNVAKGYFPRDFDDRILKELGIKPRETQASHGAKLSAGTRSKVTRITAGYKRANQETLYTANPKRAAAGQTEFSTDVPLVIANHLRRVNRATSEGEMFRELAALGRPVRSVDELRPGEQLYKLSQDGGQFGLSPVKNVPARVSTAPSPGAKIELPDKLAKDRGGQYVALNPKLVEEVTSASAPITKTKPGEMFDAATGLFKRSAIASAAFHIRNAIGDVQQAYYQIAGHRLPGAYAQGARAANRARQQAGQVQAAASEKTIKVAGDDMPLDEFIDGARKNGVLDAGWFGRELDNMGRPGRERVGVIRSGRVVRGKQALDRWMTARENIMRLGSYKVGLDNGLTESQAAAFANKLHIDYGDLSDFERVVMRRAMPFYTWTARSLPLAAETLITRPGKFANLERIREGIGNTFSDLSPEERDERMTEAVLRQLPAVIKIGGEEVGISASLPATLLNEMPTGVSKDALLEWQKELSRTGWTMVNPLVKAPFEWGANRTLVTKADIEDPKRPLTAAPSWARHLHRLPGGGAIAKALDVTENYKDPKSGKTVTGWRGKADWTYDQLMLGWYGQAAAVAGAGRTPGAEKKSTIPSAIGLRVDPLNKQLAKRAGEKPVRDERNKINRELGKLRQTGMTIEAGNASPRYKSLNRRLAELDKLLHPEKAAKSGGGGGDKYGFGGGGGSSGGGNKYGF